jgi:hypothetical protein
VKNLTDGLGAALGSAFALATPLMFSGNVWYVSSVTGTDAVSPAGKDRAAPLATLLQAVTNAAAGDIIVLLDDHSEVISTKLTVNKRLRIEGEGRSGGYPTAQLKPAVTGAEMLELTAARTVLSGIKFTQPTTTGFGATISVEADEVAIEECKFELGEFNDAASVLQGSSQVGLALRNCAFISQATTAATRPFTPVVASGSYNSMDGVTFDGGTNGFNGTNGPYACDGSAAAQTAIDFQSVSLLRGADMLLHASTTGWVNVGAATGGARVDW